MSEPEQEPDMNSSEVGHEPVQWVSIPDAALKLGISERAVYKRCRSGTLERRSLSNGRVEVALPLSEQPTEPVHEPMAESSGTGHEPGHEHGSDALVEQLQSENRFLRLQLQQRDVAESEFRRLLLADRQELARLMEENRRLMLMPPVENAVQDTPEARTEQESTETVNHRQDVATGVQSGQETVRPRRWWEVWRKG